MLDAAGADAAFRARLQDDLDRGCVNVTLLGQIKSGKSALANALIGRPGLLPVDVNPWTAAITSLHVNQAGEDGQAAKFEFFDEAGWKRLAEGAGRLGALAGRASDEDELERLREQARALQRSAQARLGRNYEMLLGGVHRHGGFDAKLLARYIVLGEEADPNGAGRYAELTRRAQLWLDAGAWPIPLSIHDTPGVNDPLLVREEITLDALKDTDVGLVVLNAAQALTSEDVALLRTLAALRGAGALIFVNRIDDLGDPAADIPAIERSLRGALLRAGLDDKSEILFGSALWAETDDPATLPPHSREAFAAHAARTGAATPRAASGVDALREAIVARAASGEGRRKLSDVEGEMRGWIEERRAALASGGAGPDARLEALEALMVEVSDGLERVLAAHAPAVTRRMEEAVDRFADVQADALRRAVMDGGKGGWQADIAPLRADLSRLHEQFAEKVGLSLRSFWDTVLREAGDALAAGGVPAQAPEPPRMPVPAALSRAVSFDMDGRWWSRWRGRRRYAEEQADALRALIKDDMAPLLAELRHDHETRVAAEARRALRRFFELRCMAVGAPDGILSAGGDPAFTDARRAALTEALDRVSALLGADDAAPAVEPGFQAQKQAAQ
ncbi:dynamin family protein [Rhodovulum sp. DZ06]|uniref:dynamin family protein n=1 Tax=Rhodovulum sp. DZ06 TaxID=3425126 RepID=UPI003D33645E